MATINVKQHGTVAATWFYAVQVPDDLTDAQQESFALNQVRRGMVDSYDFESGDSDGADDEHLSSCMSLSGCACEKLATSGPAIAETGEPYLPDGYTGLVDRCGYCGNIAPASPVKHANQKLPMCEPCFVGIGELHGVVLERQP